MPIALAIMVGLYLWVVLRRSRGAALPAEEIARLDRLLRFVRIGLVVVSLVTLGSILWISNPGYAGGRGKVDVLSMLVVAGTIISYGFTIAAAVWCVVHYRNAASGEN